MGISKALLRLLHLRGLEEEQRRLALETVLARLHRAEAELENCRRRERRGRALLRSADGADRAVAAVEIDAARKQVAFVEHGRAQAEREAAALRAAFLEKRTERRQAEALIEGARAAQDAEARQRAQQQLDEWHASRREASGGGDRRTTAKHEENVSEAGRELP